MRPVIIKAYASLFPASRETLLAVTTVLANWHITSAADLAKDMLLIQHEGDFFPADDIITVLRPFLTEKSEGKLDVIDLEHWTLRRVSFEQGNLKDRTASLDHALERV